MTNGSLTSPGILYLSAISFTCFKTSILICEFAFFFSSDDFADLN